MLLNINLRFKTEYSILYYNIINLEKCLNSVFSGSKHISFHFPFSNLNPLRLLSLILLHPSLLLPPSVKISVLKLDLLLSLSIAISVWVILCLIELQIGSSCGESHTFWVIVNNFKYLRLCY